MTYIRSVPDLTPAERFCAARQAMLRAWLVLAQADDVPHEDLLAEIEATTNAMRQVPMVLA